ncbi:ferric reductase-like transmembrane domain-containing protein [Alteraurantiacibacter aquimixticola]|uniref:Iron reductase n=1 Tax=Alteraurantiacibacter aquimixticola TaxID=2489173 RepID=A0A4T3F3Y9_9SPHN|nr:ferric reductase-like transmembrane domain-containing protein [Alteraurantiacibacter aquimixticola]TIX51491.1 iron reductase [Alteraurantiacibacter aquimixticola]
MSWRRILLWLLLAVPTALMLRQYASGEALAMHMYHPSGETALRLMLLAMLVGPMTDIFGPNRFLRGWMAIRRNLGVAAFCYGALHLAFYFIDMGALAYVIDELPLPSIWTGWLSFAFMLAAASISTDRAMRRLGRSWKRIQQGVYPAYLLACIHWWLLDRDAGPALVHLAPLLIVWTLRLDLRRIRKHRNREQTA